MQLMWQDKRFFSLNVFLRNTFGGKTIKIALDAGLTCPNRDGTLSHDGCIFCGGRGSGDFAFSSEPSITRQFALYRQRLMAKWPNAGYIAYFQAYTNTYADVDLLEALYMEALAQPGVCGLSIATRPDCLGSDVMALLNKIAKKTYLFVELGFQSSKSETVTLINRCYENAVFDEAVFKLKAIGANVVCHVIMGLPYETKADMLTTIQYVCALPVGGIKLHELYVAQNTKLAGMYNNQLFEMLDYEGYIDIVADALERIPPAIVIHRLTGDAPKNQLDGSKRRILNGIDKELVRRNSYQGKMV